MNILNRYIAQHVFGAVFITLLVIVGLSFISEVIDQMGRLEAQYQAPQAFFYSISRLPEMIYDYIPFACLVGCLFGLGALATSSELTVIRASGVSMVSLVVAVFKPVAMMALLGLVLGQYIAPVTEQVAESKKALALYGDRGYVTRGGVWTREGNTFMHFSVVQPNGVLYGVSHYIFDENQKLRSATYSDRATFQGDHWLMEGVVETNIEDLSTATNQYDVLRWDSEITPDLLSVVIVAPEALPMTELWQYARYLNEQGQNNSDYLVAFWKKTLQPLTTFSLVLVAISFVFGPLRSVTMGFRIFTGAIFGIVFQTVQNILGPASQVFGFAPIYATLMPAMLCIAIGLILLKRVR